MKVLKSKKQMFLYACSAFGVNLLNIIMGSFLCSALIAKGFGADAIANQTFAGIDLVVAGGWAAFSLIAKILDGIIDIPMASFSDNLKCKWGRRRPTILIGLVVLIGSYVSFALFTPQHGATWLNTIYYGIVLCVFYCSYTLTMVSYYATFTEIVDNEKDRNYISNVKSVCDIVYFIVGYVVVGMMLKGLNIRAVSMILLPLVLFMLIPLFMIKEPSTRDEDAAGNVERPQTVNLIKSIGYTLKNKDFICWMIVYSFLTFGVQLYLGGINEYFSVTGMSMIYVMVAAFAPVPLTLMIYNNLIKKKGFRFAIQYVLLVFGLSMAALFAVSFMPNGVGKTIMSIVGGLICSFAVGAIFSVAYSIPSQLAADDEKRTGISHSAMYFAVQGLFAGIASGLGSGVVLTALKTANAVMWMTLISAVACVVAFGFTYILPQSIVSLGKEESGIESPKKEGMVNAVLSVALAVVAIGLTSLGVATLSSRIAPIVMSVMSLVLVAVGTLLGLHAIENYIRRKNDAEKPFVPFVVGLVGASLSLLTIVYSLYVFMTACLL